jgi:hypothetical protein
MKNLEDAQREMRERNARKRRAEGLVQPEIAAADDSPEVVRLKPEISALKEQVIALQMENNRLREQKTVVVERPPGQDKPYRDSVKEQQHNFLKYSNVRRY